MAMGGGKSKSNAPKQLGGIDFSSAQYGACIPVVFGRNKLPGNVIWYGDFKATPIKEKQPGKGGGSHKKTTGYEYSASFVIGIAEGVGSVQSVYNGTITQTLAAAGGVGFTGTFSQSPWAHLTGLAALNYSGTGLAAFQDLSLGSSASLPNLTFEWNGRNQYNGTTIVDANPADIVTAICTDPQVGVSFGQLGSVTNFSTYCVASNIFFSPVYDNQAPARQALDDLFKYSNVACWFSEGVLKTMPYGDMTITGNSVTYTPNLTPVADLTANDFITNGPGPAIKIHRKAPSDSQNIVRLEYKDRTQNYRSIPVQASIDQDVVTYGQRALQSQAVDMITSPATARFVAQNLLQRGYYVRNVYELKLSWRWCWLEPMDIVTLTETATVGTTVPVRIIEVAEDDHGLLTIIAEELPDGIGHAGAYGTQTPSGTSVDPNIDPGGITAPYVMRGPGFLVPAGAPEIWAAIASTNPYWGGADIYISRDNVQYTFVRTHTGEASYGYLTNTMAIQADLDTVSTANVVLNGGQPLLGGTNTDRDEFATLMMIDTELMSYKTATLAAGPSYNLTSLRRGAYGTTIAAHGVNAPFVRLDKNIIRIPVDPSQVGNVVYLKFVSFNIFGLGPRTLASETAYAYTVGTNIEFPDVPLVPSSFAVVPVADGVNIKWVNSNPAAVACTSVEYSTTGGPPWTVLGQVGPTHTHYHHAFNEGSTFYYRARSRGYQISAQWSGYTATLNSTGKTTAPPSGANLAPNASFVSNSVATPNNTNLALNQMASDGWRVQRVEAAYPVDCYSKWFNTGWIRCAVIAPAAVPNGTLLAPQVRTLAYVPVEPGQYYQMNAVTTQTYSGILNGLVTASSKFSVVFYQADGTFISQFDQTRLRSAAQPDSLNILCPTNAAVAHLFVWTSVQNNSGAAWTHTGTVLTTDFSSVSFIRVINDTRELPQIIIANGQAKVPTAPTYTAAAGAPATATISVPAWVMTSGNWSLSYGAKTVGVTGTNGTNVTYFLYLDDPTYGGTGTLVATTVGTNVYGANGRVYLGTVTVAFPASGSGSGGGSGGGSGTCVCVDMFLFDDVLAMEARPGLIIDCLDLPVSDVPFKRPIGAVRFVEAECARLITDGGAEWDGSITTPFDLLDRRVAYPLEMLGEYVVTDRGIEKVVEVIYLGMAPVAKISVGGVSYAAGRDPSHRIYSHNVLKP